MTKLEVRPTFLLGVLAVLGFLIILVILATGIRGQSKKPQPVETPNREVQQRTLERLDAEITALLEGQFPTIAEAQQNALDLFLLAQEHGVEVRSLTNSDPQPGGLGSLPVSKLVNNVEVRGPRSKVIGMLLALGDAMLISNVSVNGPPEDWVIQFVLTQYVRPS